MAINCCHKCISPKRYPGCKDNCEEYKKAKLEHDKMMKVKKLSQMINYVSGNI